jgi:hypothetical protein
MCQFFEFRMVYSEKCRNNKMNILWHFDFSKWIWSFLLFSGLQNALSMYKMPCLTTMSQGANLTLDNVFRRRLPFFFFYINKIFLNTFLIKLPSSLFLLLFLFSWTCFLLLWYHSFFCFFRFSAFNSSNSLPQHFQFSRAWWY